MCVCNWSKIVKSMENHSVMTVAFLSINLWAAGSSAMENRTAAKSLRHKKESLDSVLHISCVWSKTSKGSVALRSKVSGFLGRHLRPQSWVQPTFPNLLLPLFHRNICSSLWDKAKAKKSLIVAYHLAACSASG